MKKLFENFFFNGMILGAVIAWDVIHWFSL